MVASFRRHPVTCRYPRQRSPERTAHRGSQSTATAELSAEVQSLRARFGSFRAAMTGCVTAVSVRGALGVADQVSALRLEMRRRRGRSG